MKPLQFVAFTLALCLCASWRQINAAIIPAGSSVTFNLYGTDYAGPNSGVVRHPDSSGPFPIALYPNITDSAVMFDPSPASLTSARGNATYTSTGNNELVLAEGQIIQPETAQTVSTLTIDTATAFLSIGSTPAHQTNLTYQYDIDLYPANPGDPAPFASFDAKLLYFINGVFLPDVGYLFHEDLGSTGGPIHVVVTGPDGTVAVPQLNSGDVLTIAGQLTFTVSHGALGPNVPEPASISIIAITVFTLSCRSSRSRRTSVVK